MEQTHSYRPLCLSLYLNYFVHGIGVIVLAQKYGCPGSSLGQHCRRRLGHFYARHRPPHRLIRIGQIIG